MQQLRDLYRGVAVHATADDEHEAALELLLLVMLADGTIRIDEQEAIEQLSDDLEWNSPTFNFPTAFGAAMSKVRHAREAGDTGIEALLHLIDGRIASRVLRAELVGACRDVASADREIAPQEQELLDRISARFGG